MKDKKLKISVQAAVMALSVFGRSVLEVTRVGGGTPSIKINAPLSNLDCAKLNMASPAEQQHGTEKIGSSSAYGCRVWWVVSPA